MNKIQKILKHQHLSWCRRISSNANISDIILCCIEVEIWPKLSILTRQHLQAHLQEYWHSDQVSAISHFQFSLALKKTPNLFRFVTPHLSVAMVSPQTTCIRWIISPPNTILKFDPSPFKNLAFHPTHLVSTLTPHIFQIITPHIW